MGTDAAENGAEQKRRSSFYGRLPAAFAYPFRSHGWAIIIVGAACYWLFHFLLWPPVHGFYGIFQFLLAVLAGGYLAAYMFKIVRSSAAGDEGPPDWPDLTDFWDDVLRPVVLVVWTELVSFLPLIVYLLGWREEAELGTAFWALLGFGFLYLPMALLAVALFDSVAAVNPVRVLVGIVKTCPAYIVVAALFVLVLAVGLLIQAGASTRMRIIRSVEAPMIGTFAAAAMSLYLLIVQMHLLGLLYRTHAKRLGWFE